MNVVRTLKVMFASSVRAGPCGALPLSCLRLGIQSTALNAVSEGNITIFTSCTWKSKC